MVNISNFKTNGKYSTGFALPTFSSFNRVNASTAESHDSTTFEVVEGRRERRGGSWGDIWDIVEIGTDFGVDWGNVVADEQEE